MRHQKNILVTGGAGFIGSNFVHYMYEHYPQYKILILDALTYAGNVANLPEAYNALRDHPQLEFWYGNILNAQLVNDLTARADMVVHFAAESHVTRSIYDSSEFFRTDVLGTQVLANAVLSNRNRIRRFIHISTSEVYGSAQYPAMDEQHPLMPMSPYAAAKCGADRLVFAYWQTYHIPAVIVRPFNNYGPRQHLEKLVPRFITNAVLGIPMRIHGNGRSARDFVHVQDTCRALDLILHAPQDAVIGETFNIGSGQERDILSIAEDICTRLCPDKTNARTFVGDRPGQVIRHTCNWEKIHRALGWEPQISWEEGLPATIDWYTTHQEWWQAQCWMHEIPIITSEGNKELH